MRLKEIGLDLAVALVLLTRLPMPRLPERAFQAQARAVWGFGLVGLVVGVLACAVGLSALAVGVSVPIAAGLVLGAQILITGALHEDGLADSADGLWGGFSRDRRLEIMKDSAIGTYGVLALMLSLGLRWSALCLILPDQPWAVIAIAALSRAPLPVLMQALPSARAGGLADRLGQPGWVVCAFSLLSGLCAALLILGWPMLPALLCQALVLGGLMRLAMVKIGGQTGDILGAAQQLSELCLLIVISLNLSS